MRTSARLRRLPARGHLLGRRIDHHHPGTVVGQRDGVPAAAELDDPAAVDVAAEPQLRFGGHAGRVGDRGVARSPRTVWCRAGRWRWMPARPSGRGRVGAPRCSHASLAWRRDVPAGVPCGVRRTGASRPGIIDHRLARRALITRVPQGPAGPSPGVRRSSGARSERRARSGERHHDRVPDLRGATRGVRHLRLRAALPPFGRCITSTKELVQLGRRRDAAHRLPRRGVPRLLVAPPAPHGAHRRTTLSSGVNGLVRVVAEAGEAPVLDLVEHLRTAPGVSHASGVT